MGGIRIKIIVIDPDLGVSIVNKEMDLQPKGIREHFGCLILIE